MYFIDKRIETPEKPTKTLIEKQIETPKVVTEENVEKFDIDTIYG